MRAVLFCLVVSANALPEAHLRGRVKDHLRDRDLSVPEDAKNYYANTDASSDEISATNLEEGGFGLWKLLRRFGLASSEETADGRVGGAPGPGEGDVLAASIKGTLSHEGASKDIKSKADTAYATGGHARPVLETEVSPRDQDKVSQHKTQGADAELADAHNNNPSRAPAGSLAQRRALTGYVMDDESIRTAVAAWLSNSASAEATYGHISTWATGGVTDM